MMTLEEVRAKIVGQRIVAVEAAEWQNGWLTHHFYDVVFCLENGIRLSSLGEPIAVEGKGIFIDEG